jgi:sec-independent protein translocase protein TatC
VATAIRPIGHEDRLSLVEHLDELRSRLIFCAVVLVVSIGVCFWQNQALIDILNVPLKESATPNAQDGTLSQTQRQSVLQRRALDQLGAAVQALGDGVEDLPRADRVVFQARLDAFERTVKAFPSARAEKQPVTLAVGEPFTVTLTVAAWFGLLFALPVILWQAYSFVLPAFSPREKRLVFPLMVLVPFLFVGGVVFTYFLVLPPAINFLQNFNDESFDILVQAKDYYSFEVMVMLIMGLLFQVPVGLLALNRAGIMPASKLRGSWRYAVVLIAVVAALLPGVDPITTTLMMLPLLALYGLSILLVSWLDRRSPVVSRYDNVDDEEDEDPWGDEDELPDEIHEDVTTTSATKPD